MSMRFLTASEAARRLDMSASGVRLVAERGDLPIAARTPGGMRLFTESDVEVYRQRRTSKRTGLR
jgi:DNA-binding transcriptional MerR regulator